MTEGKKRVELLAGVLTSRLGVKEPNVETRSITFVIASPIPRTWERSSLFTSRTRLSGFGNFVVRMVRSVITIQDDHRIFKNILVFLGNRNFSATDINQLVIELADLSKRNNIGAMNPAKQFCGKSFFNMVH